MTKPPPPPDPADLTRYIETAYHAKHRAQLPELAALSEQVETVRAGQAGVPAGLAESLHRMIGVLEVHMKKEGLILFPAIRKAAPGLSAPIAAMRADHDDHREEIEQIRRLTNDMTPPAGACASWRRLYAGIGEFLGDLSENIRLENDALFPRFEA